MVQGLTGRLQPIFTDRKSGSLMILESVLNVLSGYANENKRLDVSELNDASEALLRNAGHFAVVYHFVLSLNEFLKDSNTDTVDTKTFKHFIDNYNKQWNLKLEAVIHNCADILSKPMLRLMLHSNSSTIHKLINALTRRGCFPGVIQTLSGPGNEGAGQSEVLASMGVSVTLIHESNAGTFMKDIDALVLGADIITSDFFMNKTGSMQLALLAAHSQKPVYIVADERKQIDIDSLPGWLRNRILNPLSMPQAEILAHPPAGVEVINNYFEWIPNSLVTEFFV